MKSAASALAAPRGCSSQIVRRLSRRISQHFDHIVASSGLKTTQYSLLSHVVRLGPIRPGELARAMSLEASTLTRNLQPMVGAGWLSVDPGEDDRSRHVSVTPAGRAKFVESQKAWKRAQVAFNVRLGVATVAHLHDLVAQCMAILDQADDAPPIGDTVEASTSTGRGTDSLARVVRPVAGVAGASRPVVGSARQSRSR